MVPFPLLSMRPGQERFLVRSALRAHSPKLSAGTVRGASSVDRHPYGVVVSLSLWCSGFLVPAMRVPLSDAVRVGRPCLVPIVRGASPSCRPCGTALPCAQALPYAGGASGNRSMMGTAACAGQRTGAAACAGQRTLREQVPAPVPAPVLPPCTTRAHSVAWEKWPCAPARKHAPRAHRPAHAGGRGHHAPATTACARATSQVRAARLLHARACARAGLSRQQVRVRA